ALGNERDRFAETVKGYFVEWVAALEAALLRDGKDAISAAILAEEVVGGIQGALVLARAFDRPAVFMTALQRLQQRLLKV
ncbi:MAG: TetR/AcrR family transcriptional regulator, partial [Collimonas sp.]